MSDYEPKSKKKSVKLFYDHIGYALEELENQDLGALFRLVFDYEINGVEPESIPQNIRVLFRMFHDDLDRNRDEWVRKCEQNYRNRMKEETSVNGGTRSSTMVSNGTDTTRYDTTRYDTERDGTRGGDKSTREDGNYNINRVMESTLSGIKEKGDIFDE